MYYATWENTPRDFRLAEKWYTRAAEQGDTASMYSLGVGYIKPEDSDEQIAPDLEKAYMWLEIVQRARIDLGRHGVMGFEPDTFAARRQSEIAPSMTEAQIARAKELATDWVLRRPNLRR